MRIEIGDEYILTSDAQNVIINKVYQKQDKEGNPTGEEGYRPIKFCHSLERAATLLLQEGIKGSDAEGLQYLVDHMDFLHRDIIAAVREYTGAVSNVGDKE